MDKYVSTRTYRAQYAMVDRKDIKCHHLPSDFLTQIHFYNNILPTYEHSWTAILRYCHFLQWICRLQYSSINLDRKNNKFKEYRESRGAMKTILRKTEVITPLKSIFRIYNPDQNNVERLDE